uniref:RNA-dependent RNA polymerase n=1 Tax=Kashgar Parti tick virus 1 TaxID=2972272 RepID=A0A9E8AD80_9VIRU|nr:MAG: putative RNA-dependent RNA polymerase [Kashgar Parti tick virus 1]
METSALPDVPEDKPPTSVDWGGFHSSLKGSPGLKRLFTKQWNYPYNVEQTRMNTDPFVRKSMKLWDPEVYAEQYGQTKKAVLAEGLESFSSFSRWQRNKPVDTEFREAYSSAIKDAVRVFTPHEPLYRTSVPDVCDQMNVDTAAGFSFPSKRKSECIEEIFDTASYMAHFLAADKHIFIPPCKLALRGHLSSVEERKTRCVWVYPAEISVLEGKWALPYYKFLEEEVPTVHFGEGAMQKLAKMLVGGLATGDECTEVTLDWSQFDANVPNWMIDDAFDIVFNSFDETATMHQGDLVHGGEKMKNKNEAVKNFVRTYFKKTKIMLPDGSVYAKHHGIPSGSFFTQIIGSIVNYIAVRTMNYLNGWNARRTRVLGDDSSFLIPMGKGKVEAESVSEQAWYLFGFVLKKKKLRIAEKQIDRKFLGYQISAYRYERPTSEWMSMVLYPERDVEFLEQSASRVFAFYLLGGCNDAYYTSFFHDYIRRYPIIFGRTLPLTSGLKRMFRFVFRYRVENLVFPSLEHLDALSVPFSLSLGDKPFG